MAPTPLIITSGFPPNRGGVQRYIHDLYRNMPGEPYRVLTFDFPGASEFDRSCRLRVTRIADPKRFRDLKRPRLFLTALSMMIREPTLSIHCGNVRPDGGIGYLLNRLTGVRYLVFCHGKEIQTTRKRLSSSLREKTLANAEALVACSRFTRSLLVERGIEDSRIEIITPAVNVNQFRPGPKDDELARKMGVEGKKIILSVGRLVERKGFDTVIQALPEIERAIGDVCYIIAGSGPQKQDLERLVDDLGVRRSVLFLPRVEDDDLPDLYRLCDVFALVSRTLQNGDCEGFGIVMIEAQSCGRPVIGGDSGGVPETLADGQTGILVDPTNPSATAEAMVRLLTNDDLAKSFGEAGRLRVEGEFSLEIQSKHFQEMLARRLND